MRYFYKPLVLLVVLFSALCLSVEAAPQKKKKDNAWYTRGVDIHYVTMWGGAGYSGLTGNYTAASFGDANARFRGDFSQRFIGGCSALATNCTTVISCSPSDRNCAFSLRVTISPIRQTWCGTTTLPLRSIICWTTIAKPNRWGR